MSDYLVSQNFDQLGLPPRYAGEPQPGQAGDIGLYHDPNFATAFTSTGKANAFMQDEANFGENGRVVEREQALALWETRRAAGFFLFNINRVNPELKKEIKLSGNPDADRAALLHWWLDVYRPGSNVPQSFYSEIRRLTCRVFSFLEFGSYWAATQQTTVTVDLNQKITREQIPALQAEIEAAMPFIKETPLGWESQNLLTKVFSVMEPSLSARGGFHIETANGQWRLTQGLHNPMATPRASLRRFLTETVEHFRCAQHDEEI
jgi:hypothetical protein